MEPEIVEDEVVEEEVEETESETEDSEDPSEEIDWEARAKKAEALIVKNKKEPKKEINNSDSESLRRDVEELKLSRMGYADEVIKEIMDLGGLSALDNKLVKKSADELQSDYNNRKAAAIEDGPQSQTKTKYTKEDLAKMTSEEMEKVLPHAE